MGDTLLSRVSDALKKLLFDLITQNWHALATGSYVRRATRLFGSWAGLSPDGSRLYCVMSVPKKSMHARCNFRACNACTGWVLSYQS